MHSTVGRQPRKPPKSILIVEDETDLSDLIRHNLEREGHACRCAAGGDEALEQIVRQPPDLVLLDRMLPEVSGDEVAVRLKKNPATASIPVIMLTAKAEEADELVGFALGADDYVAKPFSMKVLLARVAAVFRRTETPEAADSDVMTAGPFRLAPSHHELTIGDRPVSLTATEFRLLTVLMRARGQVLDRGQIIDRVLGSSAVVTDRTIDVHITVLRKKLQSAASWIQTVRGVGYAFRQPDEAAAAQS